MEEYNWSISGSCNREDLLHIIYDEKKINNHVGDILLPLVDNAMDANGIEFDSSDEWIFNKK